MLRCSLNDFDAPVTPDQFTALRSLLEGEEAGMTQRDLTLAMSSDPNTVASLLERSGVAADQVDYVIMGQVIQAGAGQIIQQNTNFISDKHLVGQRFQRGNLLGAGSSPGRRHVDLLVPMQNGRGAGNVFYLLEF